MRPEHLPDYIAAAACWAAVLWRLPTLRHGDPTPRAFWQALLLLTGAQTLWLPPVYTTLGQVIGIPNIAWLLSGALVLACGHALVTWLRHLTAPPPAARAATRRLGRLLVAAFALVAVLFAAAGITQDNPEYVAAFANRPWVAEAVGVYLAAFLSFMLPMLRQLYHLARMAQGGLGVGLRMLTVAALGALAYVAHQAATVIAARLGIQVWTQDPDALTRTLVGGTILIGVLGAVAPTLLRSLTRRAASFRTYQQLDPLWRALQAAVPKGLPLHSSPSRLTDALATLTARDLDDRLHLRIIGITDARATLTPYIDPQLVETARRMGQDAGLDGEDLDALAEAAALADALDRYKQRVQRASSALVPSAATLAPGGDDLSHLRRVARYFGGSPILHTIMADPTAKRCWST